MAGGSLRRMHFSRWYRRSTAPQQNASKRSEPLPLSALRLRSATLSCGVFRKGAQHAIGHRTRDRLRLSTLRKSTYTTCCTCPMRSRIPATVDTEQFIESTCAFACPSCAVSGSFPAEKSAFYRRTPASGCRSGPGDAPLRLCVAAGLTMV